MEENERWLTLGIDMGAAADAMTDLDGELEQVSLGYRFLRLTAAHLAADVSRIALLTLRLVRVVAYGRPMRGSCGLLRSSPTHLRDSERRKPSWH